jgi:hypothetical protein
MPQEFTAPTMNNKTAHQNYVRRQILDHGIYSLLDEKVSSLLSSNINNLIVHFEKPTPAYGLFQLEKRDELLAVPIQIVPRSTDGNRYRHCSSTLKCLKTGTERVEDGFEAGLERYENAYVFFTSFSFVLLFEEGYTIQEYFSHFYYFFFILFVLALRQLSINSQLAQTEIPQDDAKNLLVRMIVRLYVSQ